MKTIQLIKKDALENLSGNWGKPILVFVCTTILSLVVNFYLNLYPTNNLILSILIDAVAMIFILQPFSLGAAIFILKFIRKEPVYTGMIFDGFKYIKQLIPISIIMVGTSLAGQYLLQYVETLNLNSTLYYLILCAYLLVIFIINCFFSQVYFVINDNTQYSGIKVIGISIKLIFKNVFKYIALQLSFILWIAGVVFTAGLLMIWVMPYLEASNALFYEELKAHANKEESSL